MFDQMYELNLKYYKELTMYILAGKRRLARCGTRNCPPQGPAEQTGARRMHRSTMILPRCATGLKRNSTTWS